MTTNIMPEIVLASRNRKKSAEIGELLAPFRITVRSVTDFPEIPNVIEDGQTFAQNAAKKATETARQLKCWVIGEDSGLKVEALNGAPGIYSARFAGEPGDDEANNRKLIEELAGVPEEKRSAKYICHVAVSDPEGVVRLRCEASCRGQITDSPRGTNGFGYDPYFLIPEYHRTFGELPTIVKQHLSHRARAFERLIPQLVDLLLSDPEATKAENFK
ncbi:MAG: RdgB/HAM1 family non-canonical purine NTP pyrophosphatase [Planctomycetaceae bacterium]